MLHRLSLHWFRVNVTPDPLIELGICTRICLVREGRFPAVKPYNGDRMPLKSCRAKLPWQSTSPLDHHLKLVHLKDFFARTVNTTPDSPDVDIGY